MKTPQWILSLPTAAILAALLTVTSAFAERGGGSTGGGDNPSLSTGAGWFYRNHNRPISACIDVAPNFGYSADQLKTEVSKDWQTWVSYIQERDVYADSVYGDSDYYFQFETRLSLSEACSGNEDLVFHFGTNSREITAYKTQHERPFGLAARTRMDESHFWSQGFIWIAPPLSVDIDGRKYPDWSMPANLRAMILHEIGHVFGCAHVDGTIMAENIGYKIQQSPESYSGFGKLVPAIDLGRELYRGNFARNAYEGKLTSDGLALMTDITGHALSSDAQLTFKLYNGATVNGVQQPELDIRDGTGVIHIEFFARAQETSGSGPEVFKSAFGGLPKLSESRVIYATPRVNGLKPSTNTSLIIEYNMRRNGGDFSSSNTAAIQIIAIKDGAPVVIAVFDELQYAQSPAPGK
jgi:hypothetical protein